MTYHEIEQMNVALYHAHNHQQRKFQERFNRHQDTMEMEAQAQTLAQQNLVSLIKRVLVDRFYLPPGTY